MIKKNILLGFLISCYVMIFDLLNFLTIKHFLIVIFSIILLTSLSFVNRFLFYLISTFSLFVNSVMLHILFHWGEDRRSLFARFEVAILSPTSEIREYIHDYITYVDLIELIYFMGGIFLFYLLSKQRFIFSKLAFIFYTISIILFSLKGFFFKIVPFSYLDYIIEANSWKSEMIQRSEYIKSHFQKHNLNNLMYDKIVVIMGESANKNHMKIYGYKYNTTPFFEKLSKSKNFYKFDVIAPANQTRYAIPIDFTPTIATKFSMFKNELSIVSKFREIGYYTYWFSNQYQMGKYDTYVTSMAKEANKYIIHNLDFSLYNSKVKPDEILFKDIDKFYNTHKKEFYVFHLIGSHGDYRYRVNPNHILFKNPKTIQQEYDNTIFYTDYVLKGIFNRFKDKKTLFIYLSDHGEVVSKKIHGHGFLPPYQNEYNIPFIIYSSIPNKKLDILKKLNNKKFNMESLYYIIQYITDIKENNISYSSKVISISPNNIFDYKKLKAYK